MRPRGLERIRAHAWVKVQRTLAQLNKLRRLDWVYDDGRDALDLIALQLDKQRRALENLRPDTSPDQVKRTYENVLSLLLSVDPMLGFILRSTNVRNAFEAYDPLCRLCHLLFKEDDVRLVISSDWELSPVTLPLSTKEQFPQLIFIGLPAVEGENALLMPLAGHEIAHSVWEHNEIATKIRRAALNVVRRHLRSPPNRSDSDAEKYEGRAQKLALHQCEEVFCDMFAVRLFGNAAVAAFGYFFAPGETKRNPHYPLPKDRFEYICRAYKSFYSAEPNLAWDDVQASSLEDAVHDPDPALVSADAATKSLIDRLIRLVDAIAQRSGVTLPNPRSIKTILASFQQGCPAQGDFALGEILEAAWLLYERRGQKGRWPSQSPLVDLDFLDRVSDCAFKTMEVVEFRQRTGLTRRKQASLRSKVASPKPKAVSGKRHDRKRARH